MASDEPLTPPTQAEEEEDAAEPRAAALAEAVWNAVPQEFTWRMALSPAMRKMLVVVCCPEVDVDNAEHFGVYASVRPLFCSDWWQEAVGLEWTSASHWLLHCKPGKELAPVVRRALERGYEKFVSRWATALHRILGYGRRGGSHLRPHAPSPSQSPFYWGCALFARALALALQQRSAPIAQLLCEDVQVLFSAVQAMANSFSRLDAETVAEGAFLRGAEACAHLVANFLQVALTLSNAQLADAVKLARARTPVRNVILLSAVAHDISTYRWDYMELFRRAYAVDCKQMETHLAAVQRRQERKRARAIIYAAQKPRDNPYDPTPPGAQAVAESTAFVALED